MHVTLHVVMLLGGAIGLCCLPFQRPPNLTALIGQWLPMVGMLAAMADMAVEHLVIPPMLWCLVLLVMVPLPFLGRARFTESMALHRSLALLAMFALMTLGLANGGTAAGVVASTIRAHTHSLAGGGVHWLIGLGVIAFIMFSIVIAFRPPANTDARNDSLVTTLSHRIEAGFSGAAVAAMAVLTV